MFLAARGQGTVAVGIGDPRWRCSRNQGIFLLHSLPIPFELELHFDLSTMAAAALADVERGIERLEQIEGIARLKLAHGRWQSLQAELNERIANDKSRVSNLTNEIYQLVGFASSFQGLLLTAVAQASQLKCHNVGIPLALSLFATVVTLAGVWQKKGIITKLKRTLSTNKRAQTAYEIRVQTLEQQGNIFNFNNLPPIPEEGTPGPRGICSSNWVTYNNGVAVCVLLLGGIC